MHSVKRVFMTSCRHAFIQAHRHAHLHTDTLTAFFTTDVGYINAAWTQTCIHARVLVWIHTHAHKHTCAHTHTHTHTHTSRHNYNSLENIAH